ncbi:MAG: hypothetical protein KA712_09880 [Myxococcales bacterium]|nr:hypothetical protein [Myxococcales bacterium]
MRNASSSWDLEILLYALGFVLVVLLFMGPAMWSSSKESMFSLLLRTLRTRRSRDPASKAPPRRDGPFSS